jgi:hypothetical protein
MENQLSEPLFNLVTVTNQPPRAELQVTNGPDTASFAALLRPTLSSNKWACNACTFLNFHTNFTCEICGTEQDHFQRVLETPYGTASLDKLDAYSTALLSDDPIKNLQGWANDYTIF